MRAAGRIAAAIEVLTEAEARRRPVVDALKDWGLSHRFAGSSDRSAIMNLAFDALRWRRSSAWRADDDSPRAVVLGTLRFRWGVALSELAAMAEEEHGPGALTETERATLRIDRLADAPADVRADVPEWIVASLEANFSDDWEAEAKAMAARAPLDLRVNIVRTERDRMLAALARFGAVPTALSPIGLRMPTRQGWERATNIEREEEFQRGLVEIQDEGSQLAALLVGAAPGEEVLDLCAGAGGKTLALAAEMDDRGKVHATDADQGQLAPIFARLKRADVRNVTVHRAGSDLAALHGTMDRVLVDAPCSGSGTWRRRPDTKWRLNPDALDRRIVQQRDVLDAARPFVRPGGALVYVTCSVLPEENEAQVADFLDRATDFELVTLADAWAELCGDAAQPLSTDGASLTMTPASTGTDGFFVAALVRAEG